MHNYFIDENGNYFEAIEPIETPNGAIVVTRIPAAHWFWQGGKWVEGVRPLAPIPASISFAQLLIGLVSEQWITEAEGRAWRDRVALPEQVQAVISSLPVEQQFAAETRALAPSEILRADPLVEALGSAAGKTTEELDEFFRTYSQV